MFEAATELLAKGTLNKSNEKVGGEAALVSLSETIAVKTHTETSRGVNHEA